MIEKLERKYGIKIEDDSYWHPLQQRFVKRYKVYSADGCSWDNNLTWRGLLAMLKEDAKALMDIKNRVRNN